MHKVAEPSVKRIPKWFHTSDPSRLTNPFEFGPAWLIHLPMKIFGLYWGIRLRNLGFFEAANPGLENGGLFDYSKNKSLEKFRRINVPKTFFLDFPYSLVEIEPKLKEAGISFPLVVKPDFGERGREVEFIGDMEILTKYFSDKNQGRYLLQEYLGEGFEFGVFFTKDPKDNQATITSLTLKIPLQVIGDGQMDIKKLVISHPRASRYPHEIMYSDLSYVPLKNELVKLSQKGNHCKGAIFLDCSDYIDEDMVAAFERICAPFEGFFYGRLDVKVKDWEDLWEDERVRIIEVNGCNSEPIHIYSPENTYLNALKSVKYHFSVMAGIAKSNLESHKNSSDLSVVWANYLNFRKSRKL